MRILRSALLTAICSLALAMPATANEGTTTKKPEPTQVAQSRAFLSVRLAALDEISEMIRVTWERYDTKAAALREAGKATEAADAERAAHELAQWFFKFQDERAAVQRQLERAQAPVVVDTAAQKKAAKLEQRIRELDDTYAYKMSKHDESHAQADEYRSVAATKAGAEREKYLRKADAADQRSHEWERLANEYAAEADRLRAELDALLGR